MADTYKVFPSIGVARVGNATQYMEPDDYYYIEPETSGGLPILPNGGEFTENDFRSGNGGLKRQAARFRVYCFPEDGSAPYEVLPDESVSISWTVHLANKKAVWYEFSPVKGEGVYPPPTDTPLRNPDAPNRSTLIIDPGPRTLTGPDQTASFDRDSNPDYSMTFPPKQLLPFTIDTLGEIKTDSDGRLLVIGGLGHAGTSNTPYPPEEDLGYANNDNWWDDTSDGPVSATIVVNGQTFEADPAWVVVTPPAYAPEVVAQITMYDVMFDVAVRYLGYRPDIYSNGEYQLGEDGYQTQFDTEIKRPLDRAYPYNWVGSTVGCHKFNYGNSSSLYSMMRSPEKVNERGSGVGLMPMLAGDVSADSSPMNSRYVTFTETTMKLAQQWNDGYYTEGNLPIETEPEQLTRAALDNCSGAAFAPGIEMTWFSRRPEIYTEAFRLKKRNYGSSLSTGATDLSEGLEPGDFTKFMAIPWQADFNECYIQNIPKEDDPSSEKEKINWWPAQRLLMVYPQEGGEKRAWVGSSDEAANDYLHFPNNTDMVEDWFHLGFVFNLGTEEEPNFVEVQRTLVGIEEETSKQKARKKPKRKSRQPRK